MGRVSNREVTALVYEIAKILDDIQTKINGAIMAQNNEERTRVSRKKKSGQDLADESSDIDLSEVPQYQSFLKCLSEIRYLLVQEREKMFPSIERNLFIDLLFEISDLLQKEQEETSQEASKKEPPNAALK